MKTSQQQNSPVTRHRSLFYGWWVVMASTACQFLMSILWIQSYGAYVVLLRQEFNWSKSTMSAAFSLAQVLGATLAPAQGWLIDKIGARILMNVGILLFSTGLMLLSQIHSIIGFYVAFAIIVAGVSLGGFSTVTVAIVGWFQNHRAKALSISQTGFAFGGLCVPLVIFCLESYGWRSTALGSGLLMAAIGIPLAQIFRSKPNEYERIDEIAPKQPRASLSHKSGQDFSTKQALRTPAFWLISIGHGSALLTVSAISVHLVLNLTENFSYSLSQAGFVIALMTTCQLCGQLSGGFLGDVFNKRIICMLCMIGHAVAVLLLAFFNNTLAVIAFALIHGLSWGVRGPLMVALRADYFGPSSFGKIMGMSSLIVMMGMAIGPIVVGYLADLYGNYRAGFSFLAGGSAVGMLCFWLVKPPKRPDRKRRPVHPEVTPAG